MLRLALLACLAAAAHADVLVEDTDEEHKRERPRMEPVLFEGSPCDDLVFRPIYEAGKELLAAAIEAVAAAKGSGVPVLINDRVDIALASGAAGAHLGQEDLDVTTARKILGPAAIIGATAKTPELAKRAVAMGADYIGSGAVYETSTKSSSCIGLEGLSAVCAAIHPVPVVGIGGIGHENARAVVEAGGAQGVAVVSAVFDAKDVQAATEALLQVMCAAKAARA